MITSNRLTLILTLMVAFIVFGTIIIKVVYYRKIVGYLKEKKIVWYVYSITNQWPPHSHSHAQRNGCCLHLRSGAGHIPQDRWTTLPQLRKDRRSCPGGRRGSKAWSHLLWTGCRFWGCRCSRTLSRWSRNIYGLIFCISWGGLCRLHRRAVRYIGRQSWLARPPQENLSKTVRLISYTSRHLCLRSVAKTHRREQVLLCDTFPRIPEYSPLNLFGHYVWVVPRWGIWTLETRRHRWWASTILPDTRRRS